MLIHSLVGLELVLVLVVILSVITVHRFPIAEPVQSVIFVHLRLVLELILFVVALSFVMI